MKSMTGYAKHQCVIGDKKIIIEIKTLNSKQMDTNVRLPFSYRDKDLEIRSMLNQLERGKIDFILTEEDSSIASAAQLNHQLLQFRYEEVKSLAESMAVDYSQSDIFTNLLRQQDLWVSTQSNEMPDNDWQTLREAIQQAINQVDEFRAHEGNILLDDFVKHIDLIEQFSLQIPQYESERIDTARERLRKYIADFNIKDVDENRFEQELIYYLEKLDITEEKVRLKKHIEYFRSTMNSSDCSGKKLGFIVQEIGREINTTGSKANHVEIQKLVVQMKDELEKIKEQLGNIL